MPTKLASAIEIARYQFVSNGHDLKRGKRRYSLREDREHWEAECRRCGEYLGTRLFARRGYIVPKCTETK